MPLRPLALCWLLFACHCCALAAEADAAASVQTVGAVTFTEQREEDSAKGALFKVSGGGGVVYLFGTIHAGNASMYPLAPAISRALAGADELVLELDTRDDAAFQRAQVRYGHYSGDDTIRNHVSAATLKRLTTALRGHGIPLLHVDRLKPWLLANYLMGLELQRSGLVRAQGNEAFLLEQVKARGTAVTQLESADYQLALFDTLDQVGAEAYLCETLDQLADGRSMRRATATIAAWRSGDSAALDAVIAGEVEGSAPIAEFTRRMLLGKRNPEMAERIEHIMKPGKTVFVGVGLLHLLGADGLPRLLAQRGLSVQRVN